MPTRARAILQAAALAALPLAPSACRSAAATPGPGPGVRAFVEVRALVESEFFDPTFGGRSLEALCAPHAAAARAAHTSEERAAAIRAFLTALGASHTAYLTPDEPAYYELLDLFRAGPTADAVRRLFPEGVVRYDTIGVVARELGGGWFAADVLEGSPAAATGLRVGDRLLAVDGEPFHPLRSFAGRAGRTLRLTWRRTPLPASERTGPVVPVRVQPEELLLAAQRASARVIEHAGRRVAYVRLRSWASPRYQAALVESLARPELAAADALVLDIRGGWGGADPSYVSLFDARVPELDMTPRGGEPVALDRCWRRPVVLLVDEGSRSGKEVIAWAFRRHGIGPVVGARTAGAVLGGRPFVLSDGTLLYLAVADVLVDGERLEGVGVEPDVAVARLLPYCAGADPQLEAALAAAVAALGRRR